MTWTFGGGNQTRHSKFRNGSELQAWDDEQGLSKRTRTRSFLEELENNKNEP